MNGKLVELYDTYVDTYRIDGRLPPMMELKRCHTGQVVRNAELVVAGERYSPREAEACLAAALLHDTGRYEQLRVYNTFRDSESVDHAVCSHDIVRKRGWLEAVYGGDAQMINAVSDAVLFHNRRDLPDGMSPLTATAAKCVRDADKLDIFRVLEDRIEHTDWRTDATAFWNLRTDLMPNPAVVAAVRERRPVDYQNILSLADFVLIQIGWMRGGLYSATARRLAVERGHFEYRRRFLLELVGYDCAELAGE